jgi:hypothetical protein
MRFSGDDLLRRCPNCGAWPMATSNIEDAITWGRVTCRCGRCHRTETVGFGAAAEHEKRDTQAELAIRQGMR